MDFSRVVDAKRIVQRALGLPVDERSRYLDEECGSDLALRREVDAYLSVPTEDAARLDQGPDLTTLLSRLSFEPGDLIDNYAIQQLLGQGGMGVVYLANDTNHDRQVALKILLPHTTHFSSREKESLARLHHPNIATLFASGQTAGGLTYLAMEYVRGKPVDQYCAEKDLNLRQRLDLFETICRAVQYAHLQLVAHRDIKPSNILVTEDGVPKLLDFGVAKSLLAEGESTVTKPHERALTIAFSSPEQIDGKETGAATDIYSLGVLLVVLLTGRLPYRVENPQDLPWAIRHHDPVRPSALLKAENRLSDDATFASEVAAPERRSRLRRQIRGDIDAIALRALRSDPDDRYNSALELADDIRRHLAHRPVSARSGTRTYIAGRFARRYWAALASASGVLALVLIFLGVLISEQRETEQQRLLAVRQAGRAAAVSQFLTGLFDLTNPFTNPDPEARASDLLEQAVEKVRTDTAMAPRDRSVLLSTLGQVFLERNDQERSEALLLEALTIQRSLGSEAQPELAETLARLGNVANWVGRFDEAKDYFHESLEIQTSLVGANHFSLGPVVGSIGTAERGLANYDAAAELLIRARELNRSNVNDPGALSRSTQGLALVRRDQGRLDEAEQLYEEALSLAETNVGPTSMEAVTARGGLATLYMARSNHGKAEELLVNALDLARERLGSEHSYTASLLQNLGLLRSLQDDHQGALSYMQEALAIYANSRPSDDPAYLTALNNVGILHFNYGDYGRAEPYLIDVLAARRRTVSPSHPDLALALNNLAALRENQGKFDEALALYQESLTIFREIRGEEHTDVASVIRNIGHVHWSRSDPARAERWYRQALELDRSLMGGRHVGLVYSLNNLGRLRLEQGAVDEADALIGEAVALGESLLGREHSLVATIIGGRAEVEVAKGRLEEAERLGRESLVRAVAAFRPDHPRVALIERTLGAVLRERGRYSEAEELLLHCIPIIDEAYSSKSRVYLNALEDLVALYEAWGKLERAAEYRRQFPRRVPGSDEP